MYKYHYVKVLVMNGTRMTNIASVTVTAKFKIELPKYGNTAKIPPSRWLQNVWFDLFWHLEIFGILKYELDPWLWLWK